MKSTLLTLGVDSTHKNLERITVEGLWTPPDGGNASYESAVFRGQVATQQSRTARDVRSHCARKRTNGLVLHESRIPKTGGQCNFTCKIQEDVCVYMSSISACSAPSNHLSWSCAHGDRIPSAIYNKYAGDRPKSGSILLLHRHC